VGDYYLKSKLLCAGLLLSAALASLGSAFAGNTTPVSRMTAMQLIQSGHYAQALPKIKKMQAARPGDVSLNYYLGACAVGVNDPDLAELCFCRVIVSTPANSPFVALAKRQLLALPHRYAPQCALSNLDLLRWKTGSHLRIYVSNGRVLNGTGSSILTEAEYANAVATARNRMANLPIAVSYDPVDSGLAIAGIHAWDWALREKLLGSFNFVADPKNADVIVLWIESAQGFTVFPYHPGQPILVWAPLGPINQAKDRQRSIKLLTAHEFGHVLGLAHSKNKGDLMASSIDDSVLNRTQAEQFVSENDRVSLRTLYSLPPSRYF
jgi:hypothetical protein